MGGAKTSVLPVLKSPRQCQGYNAPRIGLTPPTFGDELAKQTTQKAQPRKNRHANFVI